MGVGQLQTGVGNFTFRNDPNSIEWTYNLITHQEDTYGGRVIQLLGVNISSITVTAVAGSGGPEYRREVGYFFRNLLMFQRDTQQPSVFAYPTRRFSFKVYVQAFQFQTSLDEDPSRPFVMSLQVVEEVTNTITKSIMSAELKKLNDGVGYQASQFTNPDLQGRVANDDNTSTDGTYNGQQIPGVTEPGLITGG